MKRKIVKLYRRLYPFICSGCGKDSSTYSYVRLVEKICRSCRRNAFNPNQLSMFDPEPVEEVVNVRGSIAELEERRKAIIGKKKKRGGIKSKG